MDRILIEAAAWHAASDSDNMDWDALTRWMEADPRHAAAYDELMVTSALLDEHRAALHPETRGAANDDGALPAAPSRRRWLAWGGMAVAASLTAFLVLPTLSEPSPSLYATGDAARTIALEDGSRIELAPHSRLEVTGRHQERLALSGGAWFDIRHDPSRPMSIRADGLTISDIGTRFDIQTAGRGSVRVAVADGKVAVSGGSLSRKVELAKGHALDVNAAGHVARVRKVPGEQIGAWRVGRLTYDGTPLTLVAADLSRYAGVKVDVAQGVAARQFSGTLVIGDGQAALRDLSRLMGLRLDRSADGYRLDLQR
ncbi:MAG TPA: FecR domain-containing protein [Sphingopyxis sp.]|nr:FecR domain-containing protein [Sphingopyxis sp.]